MRVIVEKITQEGTNISAHSAGPKNDASDKTNVVILRLDAASMSKIALTKAFPEWIPTSTFRWTCIVHLWIFLNEMAVIMIFLLTEHPLHLGTACSELSRSRKTSQSTTKTKN